MTVPTPTVNALFGTFDKSLLKNLAFASSVSCASVLTRVLETREDPGSLNAICPSGPMPRNQLEMLTLFIKINFFQFNNIR